MNTNQQNWTQKLGLKPLTARSIAILAMLVALGYALGSFSFFIIPQVLRVNFGFISVTIRSYLFGPVVSGGVGALMDVVSFFTRANSGGPFHIGFTFTATLGPIIYGLVLYKKPLTWQRLLVANIFRHHYQYGIKHHLGRPIAKYPVRYCLCNTFSTASGAYRRPYGCDVGVDSNTTN